METSYYVIGQKVSACRSCGSPTLKPILNLGRQALTGVFPLPGEMVPEGPLELMVCNQCTLVQLGHNFPSELLYGDNYGYRSGLNQSMVTHLETKAGMLANRAKLTEGDIILDIGSNDGTFLNSAAFNSMKGVGIDPVASKFLEHYGQGALAVPQLFSADTFWAVSKSPAKLVCSVSMFYDLEAPVEFAKEVAEVLHQDGIWHFEQSYLPSMVQSQSFDTICHEHLEYYSLTSLEHILKQAGLRILRVDLNQINGGSFAVEACHINSARESENYFLEWLLSHEERLGFGDSRSIQQVFQSFNEKVEIGRAAVVDLLQKLTEAGQKVFGYGASTKGNVLLQHYGLGPQLLKSIAEVNEYKYGRETPGSRIPIISELEAKTQRPDYFLVLPWHFRDSIVRRETDFLARGGKFIFPLPEVEIFGA